MNKIKDVTLLVFAIIGFYTVISSFTTEPKNVSTVSFEGKRVSGGELENIIYDWRNNRLIFQTNNGEEAVGVPKQ